MTEPFRFLRLLEAQNYGGMFNNLPPAAQAKANEYIAWARQNLKKNDRIVWFLRWARVELAGTGLPPKEADTARMNELQNLNKRLGTSYYHIDSSISRLQPQLVHFLGLPIPQLQSIVWGKQSPRELLGEFGQMERDWKETSDDRRLIDYRQGQEPNKIIDFGDGYAWFDLETYYCDREAKAMGHCRNAGGRSSDTIFSLRRLERTAGGKTYWYPVCTFIASSDGVLGEMKGRNNDKPQERYHPYIVALLRSDYITGIRGGGYLPEHNFKLSDLDPDEREELLAEKPELGDVRDLYDKEGMTKNVLSRIRSGLAANNLPGFEKYVPEKKEFIVAEWRDFESFLKDLYDDDVEKILEIALGEADFQQDRGTVEEEFANTIDGLPEHWQAQMFQRAGITDVRSVDHASRLAARNLIRQRDDWFALFETVFDNDIQTEAWDRLAEYVKAGWPFAGHVYWNLPYDEPDTLKKFILTGQPVYLTVDESTMVDYASDIGDDDELSYDLRAIQGEGYDSGAWENYEHDYLYERRREEGLIDRNGKDTWLQGIKAQDKSLADDFLAALQGHRYSAKINDPRQASLPSFESALYRLRQLSGIS